MVSLSPILHNLIHYYFVYLCCPPFLTLSYTRLHSSLVNFLHCSQEPLRFCFDAPTFAFVHAMVSFSISGLNFLVATGISSFWQCSITSSLFPFFELLTILQLSGLSMVISFVCLPCLFTQYPL